MGLPVKGNFYAREVKMLTLNEIREAMADRKISAVARSTGLHYNVVYRAITDKSCNPSYETVKALSDYLEGSAAQ